MTKTELEKKVIDLESKIALLEFRLLAAEKNQIYIPMQPIWQVFPPYYPGTPYYITTQTEVTC